MSSWLGIPLGAAALPPVVLLPVVVLGGITGLGAVLGEPFGSCALTVEIETIVTIAQKPLTNKVGRFFMAAILFGNSRPGQGHAFAASLKKLQLLHCYNGNRRRSHCRGPCNVFNVLTFVTT